MSIRSAARWALLLCGTALLLAACAAGPNELVDTGPDPAGFRLDLRGVDRPARRSRTRAVLPSAERLPANGRTVIQDRGFCREPFGDRVVLVTIVPAAAQLSPGECDAGRGRRPYAARSVLEASLLTRAMERVAC